jgi:hypothetical protein
VVLESKDEAAGLSVTTMEEILRLGIPNPTGGLAGKRAEIAT